MSSGKDHPPIDVGRCGHRAVGDKANWYGADCGRFKTIARRPHGNSDLLAFLRAREFPLNMKYDEARMDDPQYWPTDVRCGIIDFIQDAEAIPREFKIRYLCDQGPGASEEVRITRRTERSITLTAKWPNQTEQECREFDGSSPD